MVSTWNLTQLFFYGIPLAAIVFFVVSVYRYVKAKRANKRQPGTFSEEEVNSRKLCMIVSSVIMGILVLIVVGLAVLLFMAVAYM